MDAKHHCNTLFAFLFSNNNLSMLSKITISIVDLLEVSTAWRLDAMNQDEWLKILTALPLTRTRVTSTILECCQGRTWN